MNFSAFIAYAANYHRQHPGQRVGQAYFNALYLVAPNIANEIRGTSLDPYYLDHRLSEFLGQIALDFPAESR